MGASQLCRAEHEQRLLLVTVIRKTCPTASSTCKPVDVQAPGDADPDLGHAAVYVCGDTFCSAPVKDPAMLTAVVARFSR